MLAGGSAGYAGRGITGITDDAVYPAGGLVLCPFFPALSRLVAVPLMFGSYLRFWQKHHAMPRGVKPRAILLILLTFAISLWFVQMPWVRIMLLVILACLLFYMWRIPVIDEKQEKH